ncbi:uncharacterized protein JCM10292_002453 [Rhodotorula paludigena]|uniref:uncharacterized protein n=1 Tax=Rhodotorula paludigena TaxID=86838 RepID=UPI00317B77E4
MPFAALPPLANANAVVASALAAAQFPPSSFAYIPSLAPPHSMSPGAHTLTRAPYPLGSHHPGSVQSASFFASLQFPLVYPVANPHAPQPALPAPHTPQPGPPAPQQQPQPPTPPPTPPAQQPQPQPAPPQPAASALELPHLPQTTYSQHRRPRRSAPAYANYVNKLLESSRLLLPDEPKPELALIMIVGNARTHHLRLPVHKKIRPSFDKAVLDKIDQIDAMLFHSICSAGQNLVSAREVLWADLRPNTPLLFTIRKGEQLIRTTASEMHAATGALLVELGVYRDLEGNIGKAMLESIEAMDPEGFPNSLETTKTARYIVLEQLRGWLGRVYPSKGTQIKAAGGKDQRHTRSFKAFLYDEDGKPLVPNLEELVLSGKVKGVSKLKKRLEASTTHSASSTSSDLSASSTSPASPALLATDPYASTSGASLLLFLDEIGNTASAARPVKKRRLQPVLDPLNDLAAPPPKPVR